MLRLTTRFGAPSPVGGMNRLAIQHATDVTIISQAKWIGSPPSRAAIPATMVPMRIARKVPPSTSALADGNSERGRWSGRMPYLIGPNSEAIVPYSPTEINKRTMEWTAKPNTAKAATAISNSLSRRATSALS
jgi:hypothetical protein